jgi:hypothetical protein
MQVHAVRLGLFARLAEEIAYAQGTTTRQPRSQEAEEGESRRPAADELAQGSERDARRRQDSAVAKKEVIRS